MEQRRRFYIALAVYAALAVLIWVTISDIPLPAVKVPLGQTELDIHMTLRQLTLVILAMFAVRTVLYQRLVN